MNEIKIFFGEDSELSEFEAVNKDYRNHVFVYVSNKFYQISVYGIVRFGQDFESEFEEGGYYLIDPNLVLVDEVTKEQIYLTIKGLYKKGFFDKLKPFEEISITK